MTSLLEFFPLASCVYCCSGCLPNRLWFSSIRCLAVGGVSLVSVRDLSACHSGAAVPRFLGPAGTCVHDVVYGLRSGLCFPQSAIVSKSFPPLAGVGFLAFVRGHLPPAGSVFCLSWFRRLFLLLAGWFCSFTLGSSSQSRVYALGFHPFDSPAYSFGMWSPFGSRVSLSLLKANEGLPWWFFLSDVTTPFLGQAVVVLRPPSDCRRFWWLVAALLYGLSLVFVSGLSSLGLFCCLALSLR